MLPLVSVFFCWIVRKLSVPAFPPLPFFVGTSLGLAFKKQQCVCILVYSVMRICCVLSCSELSSDLKLCA